MDKIKNISLGGFSFIIEETAYNALNNYLNEVRNHLNQNTDREEILYDVEQRMAELLKVRLKEREVVIGQDVQYLIEVLGRPEQYVESEETSPAEPKFTFSSLKGRKLYRDIDDKKIGGVLSGIAHYLQYDVTWVRIFFLLVLLVNIFILHFFTSALLLLYIAFWAVVPPARTAAQKLEMKGEAVTIDTLSNFSFTSKETLKPQRNGFPVLLKVILYFIAILLLLPLLISLIAVVLSLFGITVFGSISLLALNDFIPFIVTATWQHTLLYFSLILLFLLPVSVVVLLSLKLFIKSFRTPKIWVIANVLALVIGLIGLLTVGGTLGKEFITKTRVEEKIPFTTPSDTLVVEKIRKEYGFNSPIIPINTDTLMVKDCSFFIDTLPQGAVPYLQYIRTARGSNTVEAKKNAQSPIYPLTIKGNHISLPYYYQIAKGNVYRGQEVKIKLFVPIGTYVRTLNETFFSQKGGRWLNENGLYKVSKDSIYEVTAK